METLVKKNKPAAKKAVTICIPVYNGAKTLPLALESTNLLEISCLQVMVVDNASIDDTAQICKEYAKKHRSFSYFRNNKNLGFAGNFRRCIELTKSDYLFFIGADDYLFPEQVKELADYLQDNQNIDIVCSDLVQFYTDPKKPTRKAVYFSNRKKIFLAGDDALSNWILQSILGSIGGYLIRSTAAKRYLALIPNQTIVPQIFLGMLLASNHNVAHLPLFSFAQRLTDDLSQLANKQYLSLGIVNDIIRSILMVTEDKFYSKAKNKKYVRKRLFETYTDGLVNNIVSYRCYSSTAIYFQFILSIIRNCKSKLFSFRFWGYFIGSLIMPKPFLRRMLLKHRRKGCNL